MIAPNQENFVSLQPFHNKDSFEKIFSWGELEALLNLRPFINTGRFHILNKVQYTWEKASWLTDVNTYPPGLILNEIKKYHCLIQDCSRVNKKINEVCKHLDEMSGSASDAHIFFNLSDMPDSGLGIHWDTSHNFIVQVEGTTRFKVWNLCDYDERWRNTQSIPANPVIDVVMQPGDLIFIPANMWHQAISLSKRLSVSFPISKQGTPQDRTWVNLPI